MTLPIRPKTIKEVVTELPRALSLLCEVDTLAMENPVGWNVIRFRGRHES